MSDVTQNWPNNFLPCAFTNTQLGLHGAGPLKRASRPNRPHNTGDIVLLDGHPESATIVSEMPAICPRLLIALACPLFPPSVGKAVLCRVANKADDT